MLGQSWRLPQGRRCFWVKWGFDETLLTTRFNHIMMIFGVWVWLFSAINTGQSWRLPRGQWWLPDEFGWNAVLIKHCWLLDLTISWWLLVCKYIYFLLLTLGQSWRLPRSQRCWPDEFGWNEALMKHCWLLDVTISWWLLVYDCPGVRDVDLTNLGGMRLWKNTTYY